eukprot:Opistho-2@70279
MAAVRCWTAAAFKHVTRPLCLPPSPRLLCLRRLTATAVSDYSVDSNVAASEGPLSGIRVVDLTRVLAGPFCTMQLGDLGADVIKIELPQTGDDTRAWGPPFVHGESAYFLCVNRNKRSITVNLKSPEGVQIVRDLVAKSDVLVENYLPGKLASMGLGYETLSKVNPKLVYCSITGYGPTGPYKDRAGYDVIAAGMGGLMHITGPEDGSPVKVGVAITDMATGLYAHGAIMAALFARTRTGKGQKIDCSLLETQIAVLANIGSNYLIAGSESRRWGSAHESIVPYSGFPTSDGHVIVGAVNNRQFVALCDLLGMPHLSKDPRYIENRDRVKHRKELTATLDAAFRKHTTEEWLGRLRRSGLAHGPINTVAQAHNDPQVLHREMVREIEHPTAGSIKVAGIPVKYSETKPTIRRPPPLLGQHTDEVLASVTGYDAARIAHLHKAGAV